MKKIYFIFLISSILGADESFITKFEYAKMLYKNPRGIGCDKCHGDFGEGKVIAKYTHKDEHKILSTPNIANLTFTEFKETFQKDKLVMPKYFLADSEIESLFYYIQEARKRLNNQKIQSNQNNNQKDKNEKNK